MGTLLMKMWCIWFKVLFVISLVILGIEAPSQCPAKSYVINPSDDGSIYHNGGVATHAYLMCSGSIRGVVEFPIDAINEPIQTSTLSVNPYGLPLWDKTVHVYGYSSNDGDLTSSDYNAGVFLGDWVLPDLGYGEDAYFDVTAFMKTATTPYVGFNLRTEGGPDVFSSLEYNYGHPSQLSVVTSEPTAPPVADADGPYTIFVGDTLTLDAGGSTDDDNDIVSYVWDLDDNNSFETDAGAQAVLDVNYAYLESLGLLADNTYTIHLKVTDSESQSDIADSTLTIISLPVIEAAVEIMPNTLNLKSKGKWITCHIWLPEGYDVADVNSYSVILEDEIEAEWIWFDQDQQVVMAKFSRPALQQILLDLETPTYVELLVSGQLNDGNLFEGTDTIRLIEKTPRSKKLRSGKLAPLRKF
jgi:hypothetical protein